MFFFFLLDTSDTELDDADNDRKMILALGDGFDSDDNGESNVEQLYSKRYWGTYIKRPLVKVSTIKISKCK